MRQRRGRSVTRLSAPHKQFTPPRARRAYSVSHINRRTGPAVIVHATGQPPFHPSHCFRSTAARSQFASTAVFQSVVTLAMTRNAFRNIAGRFSLPFPTHPISTRAPAYCALYAHFATNHRKRSRGRSPHLSLLPRTVCAIVTICRH